MAMTASTWSISALAVEFQMDRRTVARRLKDVIPVGKRGRAQVYRMADAARACYAPGGSGGEDLDLQQESARLKKAQADKTELEVDVLRGTLIPGEVVKTVWGDYIGSCRAKLIGLAPTAAPRITGLAVREVEIELRDLVFQALDGLQEYDPGAYGDRCRKPADQGDGASHGAAAKSHGKRMGGRKPRSVKRSKRRARKVAD